MVIKKTIQNQNSVFWEALIIALFIFGCGLLLGTYIENNRLQSVSDAYTNMENDMLDIRAQTELFSTNIDCDIAIRKNIEFGDSIYRDALKLEKYEESKQITNNLISQHKKFATLRVLFLINSMKIQEKCGNKFDIVTYFYKYESDSISGKAKQAVFSDFLFDLKQKYGNSIILIPIVSDLGVNSVEMLTDNYAISDTAVLINNNTVLRSTEELVDIEKYLMHNLIALNS